MNFQIKNIYLSLGQSSFVELSLLFFSHDMELYFIKILNMYLNENDVQTRMKVRTIRWAISEEWNKGHFFSAFVLPLIQMVDP